MLGILKEIIYGMRAENRGKRRKSEPKEDEKRKTLEEELLDNKEYDKKFGYKKK